MVCLSSTNLSYPQASRQRSPGTERFSSKPKTVFAKRSLYSMIMTSTTQETFREGRRTGIGQTDGWHLACRPVSASDDVGARNLPSAARAVCRVAMRLLPAGPCRHCSHPSSSQLSLSPLGTLMGFENPSSHTIPRAIPLPTSGNPLG